MDKALEFESLPAPERSIERHYLLGKLLGLKATPPNAARVLELGCGTGFTLIAQAQRFPQATFLGIDIDGTLIAQGAHLAKQLNLGNVEFRALDLQKFLPTKERFDYLLCHGLFSWIHREGQKEILRICAETLHPNGVAYVSFNCLPGWFHRGQLRSTLREDFDASLPPAQNVARARKTLEQGRFEGAEGPQLKEEAMQCNKQSDAFIFHELLAEHNQAFFVSQFAELLANHQLQYFGDGNPTRMRVWRFEEETQLVQPDIPIEQPIEKEQWLDQQKPVPLRGALLGKQDLSALDQFRVEVIETCHLASPLVAKTDPPDIHSSTIEVFIGPREQTVEVADPVLKAALLILQRNWPATVGFFELTALAVEMALGKSVTHQLRRELAETLLPYFLCGLLEIYSEPLPCISKIEQHPHAFASARVIASLRNWTTSAKHEYVPLGPFEQQLLPLLDGTRDRTELLQAMHQKLVSGELGIKEADAWTEAQQQQAIEQQVDQSLYFFSEHGLLSASPTDL